MQTVEIAIKLGDALRGVLGKSRTHDRTGWVLAKAVYSRTAASSSGVH